MISLKTVSAAYMILQQAVTSGCFDYSIKTFDFKFYSRKLLTHTVSYREPQEANVIHLNTALVTEECGIVNAIAFWSNQPKVWDKGDPMPALIAKQAESCCVIQKKGIRR